MQAATAPMPRQDQHSADIFARTVPFIVERHYFGEHKKASMAPVRLEGQTPEDEAKAKRMLALTKRLINSPETTAVRQRDRAFQSYLKSTATPWRPGFWLVPVGLVEQVDAVTTTWETERAALVDAAVEAYPAQVEAMADQLGTLYNALDYPSADRFRAAFWTESRFVDFGVPNVLRTLRADVFARERQKLERTSQQARTLIEQHLAGSLLKITDHLVTLLQPKANGKKPQLRDGALDKLLQFVNTIDARDVTDFSQLRKVTERLKRVATGVDVDQLRDDADLRARTAEAIEKAKAQVDRLVTEETRRAIRLRDAEDAA